MGFIKDFNDELAKHKILIYFAILWGLSMVLISLYTLNFLVKIHEINVVLIILLNSSGLIAGIFLVTFGIKLMKNNFLRAIGKENALLLFLLFFAARLFFTGMDIILDFEPWIFDSWQILTIYLGGLAETFAGAILALFSLNQLINKEPNTTE